MNNFYLIGLTGNLGSGKSTVRRTLERLGASGLDADALAHLTMRRGSAVWFTLVKTFGLDILTFSGKIDRRKLGARVFSDPDALHQLEAITHPVVRELLKDWLRQTETPIVVVEAIKLVESRMDEWCDALWVVQTAVETQVERVVRDRQMSAEDARARLAAQGSLDEKLRRATVVIDNNGDEKFTRAQVERAWSVINPTAARDKSAWLWGKSTPEIFAPPTPPPAPAPVVQVEPTPVVVAPPPLAPPPIIETAGMPASIEVRRARRSDLVALSEALGKRANFGGPLPHEQVLKRLGERGYRIAIGDNRVVALAAWEAENLVAMMREVWAESDQTAERALPELFDLVEQDARGLLCEVSLIFIEATSAPSIAIQARARGYVAREVNALHKLWQPVVQERLRPGEQIFVKQLREEMITRPV
ncbi:MAG: dephospho-CoA kinase [Chloroflexi bacterium]|nr:dephospho-CoA kinase [Chloroflexota bacterium]